MLFAAIDIHKHAFQAAVLDPQGGEVVEARFSADRESLARWVEEWQGRVVAVAIEATTGWRWVARELQAHGFGGCWSCLCCRCAPSARRRSRFSCCAISCSCSSARLPVRSFSRLIGRCWLR